MKRYKGLFQQVTAFDNLLAATLRAARGKRNRAAVARFLFHREKEILRLREEITAGCYRPLPYHIFWVCDTKSRRITAAEFRDRVVHHALCRVIEPVFERSYIFDSYACRPGKGSHRALARAQSFARGYRYFFKSDVRKFFDSVIHAILKNRLARRFAEPQLLQLMGTIIDHGPPDLPVGTGLPIGNLTSQHFANFLLDALDHFIKDTLGIRAYLRYMDDMLCFAQDKATLFDIKARMETFLGEKLGLELKEKSTRIAPVETGIPWIGWRVFPRLIRIRQASWRRLKRKVRRYLAAFSDGELSQEHWQQCLASLCAHLRHGNTFHLRSAFFERYNLFG